MLIVCEHSQQYHNTGCNSGLLSAKQEILIKTNDLEYQAISNKVEFD